MKVLYVGHTGLVGGAERSLMTLLGALGADVEPMLAAPTGPLQDWARGGGIPLHSIAQFDGSLRLHQVQTPLALSALLRASAGVARAALAGRPDILHANTIRAGMIAAPAARALRRPLILHVRDCLPVSPATHWLQAQMAAGADGVIAISRHVADRFDPDHVARRLDVVANPFDLDRLDPRRLDTDTARARLSLPTGAPVMTLVGQITPWKGQMEAIQALALIRRSHPRVRLLLVGEAKFLSKATRYDNRAYLHELHRLVDELELAEAVSFLGEREDVPEILRATDVAVAPSWEEPFGRSVVEAMAMGVAVVATAVGGPAEIITDGIDGILVTPRRPELLADSVTRLLGDDPGRLELGRRARDTAALYGQDRHVAQVTECYRRAITAGRSAGDPGQRRLPPPRGFSRRVRRDLSA